MRELEQALLPANRHGQRPQLQRQVFVLHGSHGIGKTYLAAEFAKKNQASFDEIFWLDGSTKSKVHQDLKRIAKRLSEEIPGASEYFPSVTKEETAITPEQLERFLGEEGNNRWLLIFDNVDLDFSLPRKDREAEAYDLKEYIPSCNHGSILITTRLGRLGKQLGGALELPLVDAQQGMKILKSCFGHPHAKPEGTCQPSEPPYITGLFLTDQAWKQSSHPLAVIHLH